jgi:hypothetical protein
MSQLVKTKRQVNFKHFKRFGAFKGLVKQKNVVFSSFLSKLGLFWHFFGINYYCTQDYCYFFAISEKVTGFLL